MGKYKCWNMASRYFIVIYIYIKAEANRLADLYSSCASTYRFLESYKLDISVGGN